MKKYDDVEKAAFQLSQRDQAVLFKQLLIRNRNNRNCGGCTKGTDSGEAHNVYHQIIRPAIKNYGE